MKRTVLGCIPEQGTFDNSDILERKPILRSTKSSRVGEFYVLSVLSGDGCFYLFIYFLY